MSEPHPVTDEMVRRARLAQGIQRIGPVGEYDGKPRDEDTLLFYADSEEEMRAVLVAAFSTTRVGAVGAEPAGEPSELGSTHETGDDDA